MSEQDRCFGAEWANEARNPFFSGFRLLIIANFLGNVRLFVIVPKSANLRAEYEAIP